MIERGLTMKKTYQGALMLLIVILTGCTQIEPTPFPAFIDSTVEQEGKQEQVQEQEMVQAGLKMFFTSYFSLPEDEVLLLNQNPVLIDSSYWETYRDYRDKLINQIGDYLTISAKEKIKENYITYDFHLPKKLQLNEYVSFGSAAVEEVHIIDARFLGENMIYQVAVTTLSQVETLSAANKKYKWHTDKHYYVKAEEHETNKYTFSGDQLAVNGSENSYIYAQEDSDNNDEIKIVQYYWVEVKPGIKLQVESVKEVTPILVSEQTRHLAGNTKHIERVPYWKEASSRQQSTIKKVINSMMLKSNDFYSYYEKAFHTGYDVFKLVWERDLELEKEVFISEDSYKETFNIMLNPYKHTIKKIELDDNKIMIVPSVYSTKKQPRFIVNVPIKTTLHNSQTAYYNYRYYVGMEQNKVEFMQFMNREELTEEAYLKENEHEGAQIIDEENKDA